MKMAQNSRAPRFAKAKAWGALSMFLPSRVLHERAQKLPVFIGVLSAISDGRLVALPGGDAEGVIFGGRVSSDLSEPEEVCAVAGVAAAGLRADIGDNPDWFRP